MNQKELSEASGSSPVADQAPIYSAGLSDGTSSSSATSIGLMARWRMIPPGLKPVIVVVLVVLAVGALVRLASAVTQGSVPAGPQSSSFSPTPEGLEAYAQLLGVRGARVEQVTSSLATAGFSDDETLIVASPTSWQSSSSEVVGKLLQNGGQVVLAGEPPRGLLEVLLGSRTPTWSAAPVEVTRPASASPFVSGVGQVVSAGPGSWSAIGVAEPLLASGSSYLAISERVGSGSLVLLANSSPLQNHLIGHADNAAFALDIGLSPSKVVAFDEYDHGFGQVGGGVGALPPYIKAALLVAFGAVILWLLSAVRRFGPPQEPDRVLPPPRVAYVDAVATLLSTAPPEKAASATDSLQARARAALCRRAGVASDATDSELARAAQAIGVSSDLVATVLSSPRTERELVAVGRVSAELSKEHPS